MRFGTFRSACLEAQQTGELPEFAPSWFSPGSLRTITGQAPVIIFEAVFPPQSHTKNICAASSQNLFTHHTSTSTSPHGSHSPGATKICDTMPEKTSVGAAVGAASAAAATTSSCNSSNNNNSSSTTSRGINPSTMPNTSNTGVTTSSSNSSSGSGRGGGGGEGGLDYNRWTRGAWFE
ncbi:hypothetical protein B0T09DRAFT_380062 [Sordaria sp. MPI-SDFR-AT-0083]|nr:hypothetical protein B0T09DRAFT_380062 [Sordaria sp. MPI-SDFR-AT-0083]